MQSDLERWLEGVNEDRRRKARARKDVRTMIAQDIREKIDKLTEQREREFELKGQSQYLPLGRDPLANRIEGLRDALHMVVGVRT